VNMDQVLWFSLRVFVHSWIYSSHFFYSFHCHAQNVTIPCRSQELLLLRTLSFHPFPPASLPSSVTSSCHLYLGLPLNVVVSKFIYNTVKTA
jgi:hypothetical protein